jgi:hypothetical protein
MPYVKNFDLSGFHFFNRISILLACFLDFPAIGNRCFWICCQGTRAISPLRTYRNSLQSSPVFMHSEEFYAYLLFSTRLRACMYMTLYIFCQVSVAPRTPSPSLKFSREFVSEYFLTCLLRLREVVFVSMTRCE